MKRRWIWSIIGVFAFTFSGCDIDSEENFNFITLEIVDVELPETFDFNATYDIKVYYRRPDDCHFFQGFDVFTADESTLNIVAIGRELSGETCTTTNDEIEATFTFRVLFSNTYTLRFFSGEDQNGDPIYLEYQVPVVLGN